VVVTTFVERRTIVALVEEPCRDEPPGRGNVRTREIIVAHSEQAVAFDLLPSAVAAVVGGS
jgi:hypothetical protein